MYTGSARFMFRLRRTNCNWERNQNWTKPSMPRRSSSRTIITHGHRNPYRWSRDCLEQNFFGIRNKTFSKKEQNFSNEGTKLFTISRIKHAKFFCTPLEGLRNPLRIFQLTFSILGIFQNIFFHFE